MLAGDKKRKEIVLRVQDPDPSHVGRNIVTLSRKAKEELEITSGDIVEIEATKKTAAVVWPARPEDEGKDIIRMDSLIRRNAGVGLGEKVTIRKAHVEEAKKVVLAPTQEVRIIASGYDRILKRNFIGRPLTKGDSVWISVFGSGFIYIVTETSPRGIVRVTDYTQFILKEEPVKEAAEGVPKVAYEDIGGLEEQVQKVREMIELPMRHPELFRRLGIDPPKGVLLHGPPGCGKTLLAKAVANETNAHFISISAPEVMSKFVGEAEERIRQLFKDAQENAPSIIFIDEIDAIAPKREEVIGEVERRVVAQLLAAMDGMEARGNVIVIAATNRINSIDEALRRPGRFDREIEFPVPDRKGRKEVLQIHTRGMPLAKDVDLDHFANITHGFVGADLSALGKEAAMKALRRYLPEINLEDETIPQEVLEKLEVNREDFINGLKDVQPSALREVTIEIPNVKWEDIGALDHVKEELRQAVEWPLQNPEAFKKLGIKPPKGILLYGPPGCGKTLIAKALATESGINFISIKGPELLSMYVGESERGIRKVFRRARQVAPVIVFFDEIDSIASRRGAHTDSGVTERVVNQLLTELDGIENLKDVIFVAATNRPDLMDPGLLRPGRIDKIIKIDAPEKKARLEILRIHTKKIPLDRNVPLEELAEKTEGYSGADLEGLVREAALIALKESGMKVEKVDKKHFAQAMQKILPSISKETTEAYDEFRNSYSTYKPSYVG
ncbi:MAG: CDC48 family AAA ATPase [Candidatus Diapherotrites archaeon]|nr:CDC48 family AAA ATPase [Candidatus Diapherotrites archaeon]